MKPGLKTLYQTGSSLRAGVITTFFKAISPASSIVPGTLLTLSKKKKTNLLNKIKEH